MIIRSQRETTVETKVANDARDCLGVRSLKLSPLGWAGVPDRAFFMPGGRPLLIEFKRPGEAPRKLQDSVHIDLRMLGYDVEVHDTYEGAMAAIRRRLG